MKAYSNYVDGHAWLNFAKICDNYKRLMNWPKYVYEPVHETLELIAL